MINLNSSKAYSLLLTIALLMATLTVASAFVAVPASAQASTDWPMFHHDSALTGVSASTAPNKAYVAWRYKTGAPVISSPAVVGGKVYIGSDDYNLYCLDGATGALVWKYLTGGTVASGPAVVADKVYFGSSDHYVYCLTTSGTLVWKYQTGDLVLSSPNVVAGKVYIGSKDTYLYCLNAADGALVWKFKAKLGFFKVCPSVANGRVYLGNLDAKLYCLNATTGTQLWNYTLAGPVSGTIYHSVGQSSPVVADGRVFQGADDGWLYCVNATKGTLLWMNHNPADISFTFMESTVAYTDGKVYAGFAHRIACLDAVTGAERWFFPTGFIHRSSPAIADGKVITGQNDRCFYIFDQGTGSRLQTYQASAVFESSVAVADGKYYIGCSNGYVYCFVKTGTSVSSTLSCSVWPTSVPLGQSLTAEGHLFPGQFLVTINITFTKPDGTTINTQAGATQDGKWTHFFTPDTPGDWSVKARYAGDATFTTATSPEATFTVTGTLPPVSTTISCWVAPTSLPKGETTYVRGGITGPVSGATVTLTYTKPDATTTTRTVTTKADGTYEDPYAPDAEGALTVKASWTGDATHIAATSAPAMITVTEAVTPPPPPAAGIPMEVIYGVVAVVVIAIIAVAAYLFMKRKKK